MQMLYKLFSILLITALAGFGPAAFFIRGRSVVDRIAVSIPLGTAIWLLALVYAYFSGWSVNRSLWPTIGIVIALSLALYLGAKKLAPRGASTDQPVQPGEVVAVTVVAVATLAYALFPHFVAPANWLAIRTNPGDQNIYMMLADGVRQLSYFELKQLSIEELASVVPLGLNLDYLRNIGPSAAILLAAISVFTNSPLLEATQLLQVHLTFCTAMAAFALAARVGLRMPWAALAAITISIGFWATYISDRTAYTQQLQQPITLLLLVAAMDMLRRLPDARQTGTKWKLADFSRIGEGPGLNWILVLFLVAMTFIVYKELFIALVIPAGGLATLVYARRYGISWTKLAIISIGSLAIVAILVAPTLKISNEVLFSNLFTSLKMGARWHLSWLYMPDPISGYWGISFFPELLNSRVAGLGTLLILPVSVVAAGLLLVWCVREYKKTDMSLLVPVVFASLAAGVFFLFSRDLYRAGKAFGYAYFVPILILSSAGQEFVGSVAASARTGWKQVSRLAIISAIILFFMIQGVFAVYYLQHAWQGKELPHPYPHHSFYIDVVKKDSFDFRPFREYMESRGDGDMILDISNTFLDIWSSFAFDARVAGVVNSVIDTDQAQALAIPGFLRPASQPRYILAQNDLRIGFWKRQGAVVRAETDSLVLLEMDSVKLRKSFEEITANAHRCLTTVNAPSKLAAGLMRMSPPLDSDTGDEWAMSSEVLYFSSPDRREVFPYVIAKASGEANEQARRRPIRFQVNAYFAEPAGSIHPYEATTYRVGNRIIWIGKPFKPKIRHNAVEISLDMQLKIERLGLAEAGASAEQLVQLAESGSYSARTAEACSRISAADILDQMAKPWFGQSDMVQLVGFAGMEDSRWGPVRWTTDQNAQVVLPGLDTGRLKLKITLVSTSMSRESATIYHGNDKIGECILDKPGGVSQCQATFAPNKLTANTITLSSSRLEPAKGTSHSRALLVSGISIESDI